MFTNNFALKQNSLLLLLVLALAMLATGCAPLTAAAPALQEEGGQDGRQITVVGIGDAAGQPDEARVTVGVDTFAREVNEATTENEATIQAILAALKESDIAAEDIQTSNYNLWAEQLYGDNGPEGIAGYRVSNQVNVTIRDIDNVGDVITAAINAGANTIYGVNFTVADPAALEEQARELAIADARERAESLAALSGVELGQLLDISEMSTQYTSPMMGMGGGGDMAVAESSISPGQLNYRVQVEVTYGMEQ